MFRLNNGNPLNPGFNDDCQDQIRTESRSEDYLYIPDAETNEVPPTRARLFCGQSILSKIVTSSPLGSFMIAFNADKQYSVAEEIGFRMQYEIVWNLSTILLNFSRVHKKLYIEKSNKNLNPKSNSIAFLSIVQSGW